MTKKYTISRGGMTKSVQSLDNYLMKKSTP